MEELEKSSDSSTPRSVRAYHRGNGTLRGGGFQKVCNSGPTFKSYKRKLDYRLGYCIVGCLITIATILIIFGLFHETAHQALIEYIESTRQIITESLPSTTISTATISVISRSTTQPQPSTTTLLDEQILLEDDHPEGTISTEEIWTKKEETTVFAKEARAQRETLSKDDVQNKEMISFPYKEPDTCLGSEDVDKTKCLLVNELDEYHDILYSSHIALWNLATVNIIVAMLLLPLIFLFNFEIVKNGYYKIFYRVALFLALFFMAAQLIILITPLLYSSFMYPTIVDRLFIEKLPRDKKLISGVESRFACQFDYITQLVELSLQEPCIPRIKNMLLLPYAIVLLLIIDMIPFAFIFFTYAWDRWLKDTSICSSMRNRIELNKQRRGLQSDDQISFDLFADSMAKKSMKPILKLQVIVSIVNQSEQSSKEYQYEYHRSKPQSREDILKKAMEEPHFV